MLSDRNPSATSAREARPFITPMKAGAVEVGSDDEAEDVASGLEPADSYTIRTETDLASEPTFQHEADPYPHANLGFDRMQKSMTGAVQRNIASTQDPWDDVRAHAGSCIVVRHAW